MNRLDDSKIEVALWVGTTIELNSFEPLPDLSRRGRA